ncbi:MAG: PDZ domain-containing protein [Planctomycetes bacterium]|nr:PDZ domain-containing protein [Planctomycetota bacterium]
MRNASRVPAVLLAALIGLCGGCSTISKGITESVLAREEPREWRIHYASRLQYTLTDKTLLDVEFEGSRHAGNTIVRYQRGLGEQAQCLADQTAALLKEVRERTGVDLSTRSTVYLLRFDEQPQDFSISLTSEPNEFLLPLFLRAGRESCEEIVAQSRSFPYLMVHELVETSLVNPTGGSVLPDLAWGTHYVRINLNNYTRWFRDGFANYAGYIAYEALAADLPGAGLAYRREALVHGEPFSSLAQIGGKLFSWPQSGQAKLERAYYNAAFGLFLLIADTHGEQAIRAIVREIARRHAVNGRDLIKIASRVLGTDVRQLARDFEFPRFGAGVESITPALVLNRGLEVEAGLVVQIVRSGSLAHRAGLKERDVITAVGPAPIRNHLDFELAVFHARQETAVPLTVHRPDTGTLTLDLPLK